MKPTLFLLAAGMGSRYGGLKQLDELGPHGETIMDYSIYDAINAGFGKLVFVIRKDFEEDFRRIVLSKYEGHIPYHRYPSAHIRLHCREMHVAQWFLPTLLA